MIPPKPKKRCRNPRGALTLISGLLIFSALIRTVGDVSQAWALDSEVKAETTPSINAMDCKTDDDLHAMLKSFQKREARLVLREKEQLERQKALTLADRQINEKLSLLEAAEEDLRKTLVMADTAAESDVMQLVKVYENMKPKKAAAMFEEMEPDFAAGFLGRMRPESAAVILAGLSPQAAHTISVVLAGRNAGAATQ